MLAFAVQHVAADAASIALACAVFIGAVSSLFLMLDR